MKNTLLVENFTSVGELIENATALADMELKAYLSSLSSSQQQQFIAENINGVVTNVKANKEMRYKEAANQLLNADNSITAAGYYLTRTADLNDLAGDINEVAAKQANAATINKDITSRQYEINEWANSNKLDTLFFMQVLFISLTLTGTLYFLFLNGLVPSYIFGLFVFLIFIAAVSTLIFRARYTNVVRDPRYWNRRSFPGSMTPATIVAAAPAAPAATTSTTPPRA